MIGINITGASEAAVVQARNAVCDILSADCSDWVKAMALEAFSNACRVSVSHCHVNQGAKLAENAVEEKEPDYELGG